MVDFQPTFPTIMKVSLQQSVYKHVDFFSLQEFDDWVNSHFRSDKEKLDFAFVTCGDWDLRFM